MREHCVHLSNILTHLGVLFSYSKGSEVKHFRAGVDKMPSLNHTEWLWKLCAGHHAQQNQMILRAAAALPAQLGTLGTGVTIWRMAGSSLAEFLVSWAPESPPVVCFPPWLLPKSSLFHSSRVMLSRWLSTSEDDGKGNGKEIVLGSLAIVWPSTTRLWQHSPWGIKILGWGYYPSLLLERCSEWAMEE